MALFGGGGGGGGRGGEASTYMTVSKFYFLDDYVQTEYIG